jgi:DNA-binding transcriptional ArsR family regulator
MELREDLLFRAIADPIRRDILAALQPGPLAVHDIAERFAVSRPAISKHLRVLGEAGLVEASRSGKENLYSLRREAFAPVARWLTGFWSGRLELLKQMAERRA